MFQIDPGKQLLVKALTYAGTLPLLACAILAFVPNVPIDVNHIALCYGAVIVSFLAGIHWVLYLLSDGRCRRNLLLTSNLLALAAWTALLIPQQGVALGLLGVCFLVLLKLDTELTASGYHPKWYNRLRINATMVVILSLVALFSSHLR
jgi:hypothetical protein